MCPMLRESNISLYIREDTLWERFIKACGKSPFQTSLITLLRDFIACKDESDGEKMLWCTVNVNIFFFRSILTPSSLVYFHFN